MYIAIRHESISVAQWIAFLRFYLVILFIDSLDA